MSLTSMKVLANMEHMQYHLPYQSYPKRLVNQIEIPVDLSC